MSYTAPHLRNKKTTSKMPTIDEFPALGTAKPKTTTWTKSFSSLASEWNKQTIEQEEERKYQEEMDKELERREALNSNFGFVRHGYYEGPIYRDYEDEVVEKKNGGSPDEWTVVDRVKYRPELTVEEKNEREIAKEIESQQQEEMSVWKNEEWDVRDRRVIS